MRRRVFAIVLCGIALALASYSVAARVRRTRWRDVVVTVAAVLPFTIGLIGSGYQWEVVIIEFGIAAPQQAVIGQAGDVERQEQGRDRKEAVHKIVDRLADRYVILAKGSVPARALP